MAFKVSGESGEVKRGYQTVARLGRWQIEDDTLRADAEDVNAFLVSQGGPFKARLDMGRRQWVWPCDLLDAGDQFVARVNGSPAVE